MVAIIDYDAGNINSVEKAVRYLNGECRITRDKAEILSSDAVILPGVGAFGEAMERLNEYDLTGTIKEVIAKGTPFLGICLGLQLLFEKSEESPGVSGLGVIKGSVKRLPRDSGLKVPDIGWNSLRIYNRNGLFRNLEDEVFVYFVHSYYADAEDKSVVTAGIDYGVRADVAVEAGNVYACQFHPEKSSKAGLKILSNFLKVAECIPKE